MSLILEALKKSEQQRRLGEAPNLSSPVVATRRRRGLLPVIVIAIVVAAAVAWWLSRRAPAPAPAAPAPIAANGAGTTMSSAPQTRPTAPAAGNRTVLDRTAATRVPKADQDKRVGAPANATQATPTPAPNSPLTKPAATPSASATPTIDKSAGLRTPAPPPTASTEKREATPPAGVAPKSDTAAPAIPSQAKVTPPAPTGKTLATGDALPTVWELPYSTRKDLPALDLSMHVYSADPKQRFVVLKGDRHVEGDEIGQDLILREIRQDGLVLDYKGTKFFFPRNGR